MFRLGPAFSARQANDLSMGDCEKHECGDMHAYGYKQETDHSRHIQMKDYINNINPPTPGF